MKHIMIQLFVGLLFSSFSQAGGEYGLVLSNDLNSKPSFALLKLDSNENTRQCTGSSFGRYEGDISFYAPYVCFMKHPKKWGYISILEESQFLPIPSSRIQGSYVFAAKPDRQGQLRVYQMAARRAYEELKIHVYPSLPNRFCGETILRSIRSLDIVCYNLGNAESMIDRGEINNISKETLRSYKEPVIQ